MFISKISTVLKCSAVLVLSIASNVVFSAEKFRSYTHEIAEIEIVKMPTKITNGRILVYLPDSSGKVCTKKSCAKNYDLDKNFRTEVDGEYSLMKPDFFKSLPKQKVSLIVYKEGVVKVVGFNDLVMPRVVFTPSTK